MNGEETDGTGHRARLRKRLVENGGEALLDHELIEYLLALAIPRRDTKPIAKRLLREFGGFGALLSADAEAIMRNGDVGEGAAVALKIVQAAMLRLLNERIAEAPVLSSWQSVMDFLRLDLGFLATERVRILHLNSKNRLIRNEVMAEGSIDQAIVSVREIIRRAIDLGSAAIILVHNHPSGDPAPSRADIALTKSIIEAGRPLGIAVHDHIIIGGDGHTSMRGQGII